MIEKGSMQQSDVIIHIIMLMLHLYTEGIIYKIIVCLRVYAFVYEMSRLIAK